MVNTKRNKSCIVELRNITRKIYSYDSVYQRII